MRTKSEQFEEGAILLWVALMMVALLGIGALAVDFGFGYAVKRQLSVTADAAALAGAQAAGADYATRYPTGSGCTPTDASSYYQSVATTAATEVITANAPQGTLQTPTVTVDCESDKINVAVTVSSDVGTFLGRVFGVDELTPTAAATAQVSGSPVYGGLRPFAVCRDDYPTNTTTTHQTRYPQNAAQADVVCGALPAGNWGIVDFDQSAGNENPTGDIRDWTRNGYWGPPPVIIPGPPMFGDPGANVNPVADDLDSIIGKTVLLPVALQWNEDDGSGNGGNFTTYGVVSAFMCGWGQKGNPEETTGCWDSTLFETASDNDKLVLQWQFRGVTTSYQTSGSNTPECTLGPGCVPAIRLIN